jgi:hypothetical protein
MVDVMLAAIDPGVVGVFIPVVAILVGGMIAVTKMFTAHQREMAQLVRRDVNSPDLATEIKAMRHELVELRDRVNQQTIMLESRPLGGPTELKERMTDQ